MWRLMFKTTPYHQPIRANIKTSIPARNLSIHEYLSVKLIEQYGGKTPKGGIARSAKEAGQVFKSLGSEDAVIKAQVLAGGRGKGTFSSGLQGGVKLCYSAEDVERYADKMLGHTLVTHQTGPAGKPCDLVYICERLYSRREYYFAILMDRKFQGPVLVGSNQGGIDIEIVAKTNPEAIVTIPIDIQKGLTQAEADEMATKLGFVGKAKVAATSTFMDLYKLFIQKDCSMVEINPLSLTNTNEIVCMDAKIGFDDNADFRQVEVFEKFRDLKQEDAREVKASTAKLNYIGLDGSIGCLVNGAGLAMATMDIIKLNGGSPANFLDVGGSASEQQVTDAFKIISSDPKVNAILVNIFGGIMKCDIIAMGVIQACKTLDLKIPLIVRLQGTNVDKAKELIKQAKLNIFSEDDLDLAAKKAVALAQITDIARSAGVHPQMM